MILILVRGLSSSHCNCTHMLCCPRCRSLEVFVETGGYTGNIYRCKKCGYRGALVLEIEEATGPESDLGDMDPGD